MGLGNHAAHIGKFLFVDDGLAFVGVKRAIVAGPALLPAISKAVKQAAVSRRVARRSSTSPIIEPDVDKSKIKEARRLAIDLARAVDHRLHDAFHLCLRYTASEAIPRAPTNCGDSDACAQKKDAQRQI